MRVLVATTAGAGHFGPMVPFATALREAGHEVAVAAPASFASAVGRAGFAHRPFDDSPPEELGAIFATLGGLPDDEARTVVIGQVFGRINTRCALPGMESVVNEWRPHLVVRESTEFASYIVAEAAGIPHVHVAVGLSAFGELLLPPLEEPLTELGAEPGLEGLLVAPTLTLVPPSLEEPGAPGGTDIRRFRDGAGAGAGTADDPLPDWWDGADDPLVYVTFGSVAASIGLFPDFYRAVIDTLAELPVRVLLTTGEAGDPQALGTVPPNIHVERWWPNASVMAHAAAMVGHGGSGTTLQGLAAGLPMVVVPLFADQPYNARRVDAVGAGIALDGPTAVGELADAVRRVLGEPSYASAAQRIADEIRRLPEASEAVPMLEGLAG